VPGLGGVGFLNHAPKGVVAVPIPVADGEQIGKHEAKCETGLERRIMARFHRLIEGAQRFEDQLVSDDSLGAHCRPTESR